MLRLFTVLASAAICAGFTAPSKQRLSHTALQNFHDEGNYYDDFADFNDFNDFSPADDSFHHPSEEQPMDDDWRSFRAKLVAGEHVLQAPQEAFGMEQIAAPQMQTQQMEHEPPSLAKAQWAHPIDHLEAGSVLIANENQGGLFYGKVLLIVEHTWEGTTAVCINSIFPGGLTEVATNQGSYLEQPLLNAFANTDVAYGGNMRMGEYSLLHGFGEIHGAQKIAPGVFLGGEHGLANEVMQGRFNPDEALFVKGKCQWYPGRLEAEIQSGKWYVAAASSDLVLRNAGAAKKMNGQPNDLWKDILMCMGGYFADVATKYAGNLKP